MSTTSATLAGHVARALRFKQEPEVFVGNAKRDAWYTESAPPDVDITQANIGIIDEVFYSGGGLSAGTASAKLMTVPFTAGAETYRVTALTTSTFEVRRMSDNALMGAASNAAQVAAYTSLIPGVSLVVNSLAMTPGEYFQFKVDGPISYTLANKVELVVADPSADPAAPTTIIHKGDKYRIVTEANAFVEGARHVYVEATFAYDTVPVIVYRQLGVFTNLTRAVGVPGAQANLLPTEVSDAGICEVLENRTPVYRDIDQSETFGFLIAF